MAERALTELPNPGVPISVEVDGVTCTVDADWDDTIGHPWEEFDGHGPVSEWTTRPKTPGERVLARTCRNGYCRYYDYQQAIKIAKRDGWDAPPYGEGTAGERAVRAVEADFQRLKDYCNGKWGYVSITVTVTPYRDGLKWGWVMWGGIESDADEHCLDVTNELLAEAVENAKTSIQKLQKG